MSRVVFHVDMDSFFASCEVKRNPDLLNKAVIIGADPEGGTARGVVSTANYKAREFGVGSGMAISKAYRLCPSATFIRPDIRYYKEISNQIMNILVTYSDNFDPIGIDEAYLEVTSKINKKLSPRILAALIKKEIYTKTNLTCSIGISYNKSIAKIASDIEKPDGVTEVKKENAFDFLKDLPIKKISGVGKTTEKALNNLGITTIGELAKFDRNFLVSQLGNYALRLWNVANGLENDPIIAREESESISTEKTFKKDTNNLNLLYAALAQLSDRVSNDLKKDRYSAKTMSIKYRYEDFETHTRAKTLGFYFNDSETIKQEAIRLFNNNYVTSRKIRLIGIRTSNLKNTSEKQTKLTAWF
jgi:DNA polymerase IV (DinB-like DNA polymerase)